MKNKLLQNLSANTAQLLVNQLCGLIIFYILSTQLDKASFGKINFVLAIMLMAFNLLTLGIDQVLIRKIASNHELKNILSLYFLHVLLTGFLFFIVLVLCSFFFDPKNEIYPILLAIGVGKLLIYFSTPFKTLANGLEKFKLMAYMLIISNVTRSLALLILAIFKIVTLKETVILFVLGDLTEFIVCLYLFKRNIKVPLSVSLEKKTYFNLLREAMPQTGVVILTSVMARLDWIFIGVMISAVKLAEYSFAYKIFEIATLPLLAVAPLLLPRFIKIFNTHNYSTDKFRLLVKAELIIAMVSCLFLNVLWQPVIDFITDGKYGIVNVNTIFLLSLCIPFLYLNNFLWTIYFAQGRMKMILFGFIISFLTNLLLNIILVPYAGNEGAAISFLVATIVQTIYYLSKNQITILNSILKDLVIFLTFALFSGFLFRYLQVDYLLNLILSLLVFISLLIATRQVKWSDLKTIVHTFKFN
ncbi:oligosaccharide flippase family protein [Pedobacter sp. LMG 31464]|uniref:Oligosaccharide flippase family protein n=1 Tax=Pedobacter planticolens TaxID=2679964 RepID=A0A923IW11_9SPHI|nr:oligosaccharide flippase family protein [Pedobacter planticolens]MBB2144657.1 oligosaccharide flippase family protein [Pedobacter planticolens]